MTWLLALRYLFDVDRLLHVVELFLRFLLLERDIVIVLILPAIVL